MTLKIKCDQCNACAIQGVACHETGCPLSRRPWIEEDGYLVPSDTSHEMYNEEDER